MQASEELDEGVLGVRSNMRFTIFNSLTPLSPRRQLKLIVGAI
jgi:hypothetical protein